MVVCNARLISGNKKRVVIRNLSFFLSFSFVSFFIGGSFFGLFLQIIEGFNQVFTLLDSSILHIAFFTLFQAFLSTIMSVIPALVIARAFFRHPNFLGRSLILKLFALPLFLPSIVIIIGILSVLGTQGLFSSFLSWLTGKKWIGIYGLDGILIGHVFFNMPLAIRFFLENLNMISPDYERLARQLNLKTGSIFRLIEWPALRNGLPGIASLIFMLCLTSFTVILTLGGGPANNTLEIAIYEALRFDFNPAYAVFLTLLQILIVLIAALLMFQTKTSMHVDPNINVSRPKIGSVGIFETCINFCLISLSASFVFIPILFILIDGLKSDLLRLVKDQEVCNAFLTSFLFSFLSALLALLLSWPLISKNSNFYSYKKKEKWPIIDTSDLAIILMVAFPPMIIGAGWFVLLHRYSDIFIFSSFLVIVINALMAMPFVFRLLKPAYITLYMRYNHLMLQIGMNGYNRFRLILWPLLKRSLLIAFFFSMSVSLGDLGAVALFGSDSVKTLPLLLLSRMGSYRTTDAAGLAFFLSLFSFGLMFLIEKAASTRQ